MGDQPIKRLLPTENNTNTEKMQTFVVSLEFEPMTPAFEWVKTFLSFLSFFIAFR
jgi:hypothetical protein